MTPAEAIAEVDYWAALLGVPRFAEAVAVLRDAVERLPVPHDECPIWAPER